MMKAEYFGEQLGKNSGWIKELTEPLHKGTANNTELARKIYVWVRDNFTCTDHNRRTMDLTLKNLIKARKGNVAEINLLLTVMLLQENIDACPVLLSTRPNGFVYSPFPLLHQYNYVICRANIDGKTIFLDASEPMMGFGWLPLRCYNDEARAISKTAEVVTLSAYKLTETKYTTVFVVNDEKGNLIGSITQMPGYYESFQLREQVKEKGMEQLQKDIQKDFGTEVRISNFGIDSLQQYDQVLGIHYDFDLISEKEDIIYFNPMFGEAYRENLFKSAKRFYPVEMPFTMDETYNLQMEVPQGYAVDELPKSMMLKLNEGNHGFFEYRVSQSGNNISFRSRIKIGRAYFHPDEYEMLREFFNLVVKKQAEQIVFKKKN
ncbi:MAG: transglutaminase domain-containing protein [Bacteroidetes bacterium]|nr:transglutaminase domain-containing protein [Bacteroidota bacterium]